MQRPAKGAILALSVIVSLGMASVSYGKTISRWHPRSFDAKFTATGCGSPFEARRKFSDSVKRLKLREPAVGVSVLDPQGERVAKVSSVRVNRHRDGSREVIWQAIPGLECPSPLPPEPEDLPFPESVGRSCSVLTEGFIQSMECEEARKKEQQEGWSRWHDENIARKRVWEGEVAAHRQAEMEYRDTWGTIRRHVRTGLVYFDYKFFTKKKVTRQPKAAPCHGVCRAKRLTNDHLLYAYGATGVLTSCERLPGALYRCRAQWTASGGTPLCRATSRVQLQPYVVVKLSRPNAFLGKDWECE